MAQDNNMTNEDICPHCHLPRQGAHSCMQSMQAQIDRLKGHLLKVKQQRLDWAMVCECECKACETFSEVIRLIGRGAVEPTERCLVVGCGKPCLVAKDGAVGGLCAEHNGNVIRPRDEGEPNKLPVDQTDIDIALETAQTIEDGEEPTAADCIRACARAAQATLGNAPEPGGSHQPEVGNEVTYSPIYASTLPRDGWTIDRLPPDPVYVIRHPNGSVIAAAKAELQKKSGGS